MKKAESLQREESGNQGKAGWGSSKWLKSKEEADVAVRLGLEDSSVRLWNLCHKAEICPVIKNYQNN